MKRWAFSFALVTLAAAAPSAASITGTVIEASGDTAVVKLEGQGIPASGDSVEIFFVLAGTDEEISVAMGRVISTGGGVATVRIEKATGEVSKDHRARFKPAKKGPPAASPSASPSLKPIPSPIRTPAPSPPPPAVTPPSSGSDLHTPATGSAERVAICDGARAYVLSQYARGRLSQPIVFKVEHLAAAGAYANLYATAIYKSGGRIDALPDLVFNFCLKNNGAKWEVVYDLTRGDVPAASELEKIRRALPADFPRGVLSSNWQQLLEK
jgi:hypothetical protein